MVVAGEVLAGGYDGHEAVKHITLLSTDPLKAATDEGVREVSGSIDVRIPPL